MFEIGNTAQGEGAGGVFGFGKSSLYNASTLGTVAIYTRVSVDYNKYEDRFIIKCIWPVSRFREPTLPPNSSGVFWWGKAMHSPIDKNRPVCMHPLLGREAIDAARSIGMGSFGEDETGTKLLVLAPKLDTMLLANNEDVDMVLNDEITFETFGVGSTGIQAFEVSNEQKLYGELERMNRTAVHYFWAKYPIHNRNRGIDFEFAVRKQDGLIKISERYSPSGIMPYNLLIQCHKVAKNKDISTHGFIKVEQISSSRPRADLGRLAWTEFLLRDVDPRFSGFFGDNYNFVALLRNVELVVQYKPVPARPAIGSMQEQKGIVGVFRTLDGVRVSTGSTPASDREVSEIFRAAENQTHGEWNHIKAGELGQHCSTYVKVSLKRIDEVLNRAYPPPRPTSPPMPIGGASIMSFMGRFLQHTPGGAGVPPEPEPNPQGSRQGTAQIRPTLELMSVLDTSNDGVVTIKDLRYKFTAPIARREYVLITPVCPDETGTLALRPDQSGGLPVSILSIKPRENRTRFEQIQINGNGTSTVKIEQPVIGFIIDIRVKIIGDARFALDADYMTISRM